jgi:integrase
MVEPVKIYEYNKECEVIQFDAKKTQKRKIDGSYKNIPNNSKSGEAHEVYPFKDKRDIKAIQDYFIAKKENAKRPSDKEAEARYLLVFIVGINIGLRASDLLNLTWGDVYNPDGTFADGVRKQEKKTKKFKTFYFNQYIIKAITDFVEEFHPLIQPELHVFRSKKGGNLGVTGYGRVLKKAAEVIGFQKNVNTHSMRKTFGYHYYKQHNFDVDVLVHLQRLFNHDCPRTTLAYIGMDDEETKQYYNDMNWDIDEDK